MAMGRQIKLLLWKNWTLQKRSLCVTLFEVLLPLFFGLILVLIRLLVKTTDYPNSTIWPISNFTDLRQTIPSEILFAPNTTLLNDIMQNMEDSLKSENKTDKTTVIGFASEEELLGYYNLYPEQVWAAVVFDVGTGKSYDERFPGDIHYNLRVKRVDNKDKWLTQFTYNFIQTTSPRNVDPDGGTPNYVKTGFMKLQYEINKAIIVKVSGKTDLFTNITFNLKKMPYPPYLEDPLLSAIQQNLPLFLVLGFILYIIQTAKNIVYEKERKLKEAMKMMGLNSVVYWMSWFCISLIYLFIASVMFSFLLSIKVNVHGSVLNHSDPTLTFVFIFVYSMSVIALAFLISTVFSKANTAAFAGGLIHFLTYFPYFFLGDDDRFASMSRTEKILSCILSNNAMAFGVKTISLYEGTGYGARWSNFHKEPTVDSNFTLLTSIVMMLADTAVYLILTWYLDAVIPGEYGVPEPYYFPFTKKYWFGSKQKKSLERQMSTMEKDPKYFEKDPQDLRVGISIERLRKEFGSGLKKKVAVRGTTVSLYEGQITALLGHNGAGKTTTMSMLTGFIPPTSGTAKVNGYDIREDIANVRQSLGLCPQHNILFDNMTVEEHLYFFAMLKGCLQESVKQEVDEMIEILGLEAKRTKFSKTLSGGQKRKLSVGIALIAGSKTVILDEPTSGMDPAARRQTWDILQKFKPGRTLVLSTHFMDEADLLGDRIAIMADGVVKCCGTSYFLKKTYGAGYHLVMVKDSNCQVSKITELVKSHVPSALLESEISAELSYLLPFDESSNFEKLLLQIESKSSELGITGFGTTATTMEEVFLKVGEASEVTEESSENLAKDGYNNPSYADSDSKSKLNGHYGTHNGYSTTTNGKHEIKSNGSFPNKSGDFNFIAFNQNVKKNIGFNLLAQQSYGMFLKKLIHTLRNKLVTGVQLIIPVIFTIMALSTELSIPKATDEPALDLDLKPFGNGLKELYYSGNLENGLETGFLAQYTGILQARGDLPEIVNKGPFDDALLETASSVGIASFNRRYIIGLDINTGAVNGSNLTDVTAYFNGQPFHVPPIALSYAMNALLQYVTANNTISIMTTNYPLPIPLNDNSRNLFFTTLGTGFVVAFTVIFGMAFLIASFTLFLIKERQTGARHLQRVSGVSTGAFWFSNFLWDMINYLAPVLLIIVVFAAFNTAAFVEDNRLGILFGLFMMFGWGSLPFVYLIQFVFKTPPAGMVALSMLNILSGLATLMAVFVLKIPGFGTEDIANALDWIFSIAFPTYCMGSGIMNVYTNYGYTKGCQQAGYPIVCLIPNITNPCCPDCTENCFNFQDNYMAWDFPGTGKYFTFMAMQGVLFFSLLLLIETGKLQKMLAYLSNSPSASDRYTSLDDVEETIGDRPVEEDSDVKSERERINTSDTANLTSTESIVIKNLNKVYGSFQAVDNICVTVGKQECFGLLGQNGAGKTTTFKMLTGDVIPSSGNAWLNSHDIQNEMAVVHKNLGYCPQFDALIDQMTGREILTMFGRLRGVQESQLQNVVDNLLDIMMLNQYANRECGNYSGGNKRKLSTAIALIGDPQFIFLDEPTTGMDPGARRQLWNVLSQVRASGRTLVLTSHSMEECDALCTKIVIMVNGRFVCCGSSQHLKSKFGEGYTLICNMKNVANDNSSMRLNEFLCERFPSTKLFDAHQGYCHFQIKDKNISLGLLFGAMEKAKEQFNVEDYHIHQATLEQIFLAFTRNQIPPKESVKQGICKQMCCLCLCCS